MLGLSTKAMTYKPRNSIATIESDDLAAARRQLKQTAVSRIQGLQESQDTEVKTQGGTIKPGNK